MNKHTPTHDRATARALQSFARTVAGAKRDKKLLVFGNMAREASALVHRAGADQQLVVDAMIDCADANGLLDEPGADAIQKILSDAFTAVADGIDYLNADAPPIADPPANGKTAEPSERPIIKTSKQFVQGFVPPDYAVVGLLQRRFFYSLTGQTGAGKTAIMLVLAARAAQGKPFAGRETKKTRVLYLAAENADDVRMRWIALAPHMEFEPDAIDVFFVEGRFTISKSLAALEAEAKRHGGDFGLVIIDTGPTFFEGKEENENKQLGDHARLLRGLSGVIPGGPCIVANCHPVKHATADELLPRGGGAFLAEVDGNLTAAKAESTVELHWQGKFRGPDFAPTHFLIKTVTHQDLKDSDGRLIPTVIATYISDQANDEIAAAAQRDEEAVLKFVASNADASRSSVAAAMGWRLFSGEPNKMKAHRCLKALTKARLIKDRAGRFVLTEEGKKAVAALAD